MPFNTKKLILLSETGVQCRAFLGGSHAAGSEEHLVQCLKWWWHVCQNAVCLD